MGGRERKGGKGGEGRGIDGENTVYVTATNQKAKTISQ